MNSREPIKILYLQSTSEIGGSDISLLRLLEKLDRSRFTPSVIFPGDGPLVDKIKALDVTVWIVPGMMKLTSRGGFIYKIHYLFSYLPTAFKIASLVRREKIRIIHTNTLHNLHGWLAAKLAGVPHVWHVREIVMQSRFFLVLERFLARFFSERVIATSTAVAESFAPSVNRPKRTWLVQIPNGIDIDEFSPKNNPSSIFRDLNLPPEKPLVGIVGRLDPWKGVHVFLKAAAICKTKFPEAHYLIVGGKIPGREEYEQELRHLTEKLGLQSYVHFTDWRYQPKDMPAIHAALNILVLASTWPEPFGLVLLEAMASGKPIVATNHGGPVEICEDGQTAFLVPPDNPDKMAEALIYLLQNPDKAHEMGRAGRQRVEKLYERSRCIRLLENLYEELLRARSCAASQA